MNWKYFADIPPDDMPDSVPKRITDAKAGRSFLVCGWHYLNLQGEFVALKARYEGPGGKTFRPFYVAEGGYLPTQPEGFQLPLYGLDSLAMPGRVFVCEGEKATAALHRVGVPAVGLAGSAHADAADLSPLGGREIVLWPDHDECGVRAMETIARRLDGACLRVEPEKLGLAAKADAADVVAEIIEALGFGAEWDGSTKVYPEETLRAVADELHRRLGAAFGAPSAEFQLSWTSLGEDWLMCEGPPREFVFHNMVPLGCITLVLAAGGFGKSNLMLMLAVSVAIGRSLISGFNPTLEGDVCLVSLEDDMPEIQRRLFRIATAYTLSANEAGKVASRLKILSTSKFELLSASSGFKAGSDLEGLRVDLQRLQPRLVLLDPLAALLGGAVDENDNASAQAVVSLLRSALPDNAGVIVAAHVAKAERDSSGSARGASAWMDASRMVIALRPLNTDENKFVSDGTPKDYAALETRKSNYAMSPAPIYLRREHTPELGGVWRSVDFERMRHGVERQRATDLRSAILAVLANITESLTRQEVLGKGTNELAVERGRQFRDGCATLAGIENVSCKELSYLVDSMLNDGSLVKVLDGRRQILRPCQQSNPEHSGLNPECSGEATG